MLSSVEIALWHILEQMDGPESILANVPLLKPKFMRPKHLLPLAEALWRGETDGNVRTCISVPPRHSKTETLMSFVIWYLKRHPDHTVAYLMHTTRLAEIKSTDIRDLALRAGLKLRTDSKSKTHWRTEQGGGLDALGVGASPTGLGFNLIVVDDPIPGRAEAESAVVKESTFNWLTSDVFTRLEPRGNIIVCHTRWCPDDPIGRLINDESGIWQYINLPALNEDGSALWPEQWSSEALEAKRRDVGDYNFDSMFQGNPQPRGNVLFGEPARFNSFDFTGAKFCIAVDPAASAKTTADYSVIAVMAEKDGISYLVDLWRGQVAIPQLIREIQRVQTKWGVGIIHVESVAGFKAVPQMLREVDKTLRVIDIHPLGDKFTRALPASAAWNSGRLQIPMDNPKWLKEYLKEMQSFTGVKDLHDDCIDATAHAFNVLNKKSVRRGSVGTLLPFV